MSKKIYIMIKYLCFFALMYVLWCAKIGALESFAFGMYFCLSWCGQNPLILSILYIVSGYLATLDLMTLVLCGITVGVFLLFYFLHFRFKKPLSIPLIMIYGFLSQIGYMYMHSGIASEFFDSILSVFCGMVFLYCCIHFFQNILVRGVRRRFFVDEAICGGVVLMLVASGIYNVPYGMYISMGIGVFVMLCTLWSYGGGGAVISSIIYGLGIALSTQNISFIVRFALLSLVAMTMRSNKRIFAVIGISLVDVLIELYILPVYSVYNILSVIIGVIVFLMVPVKVLHNVSSFVVTEGQNNVMYNILERERKDIKEKLYNLSNVFANMHNAFVGMVKRGYSMDDVISNAVLHTKSTVCTRCPNKDNCLTINAKETEYHLIELSKFAYIRDKINVVDVPSTFAHRCLRLPVVISNINHNTDEYKKMSFDNISNNENRLMVAEQLQGVSEVFKTLSIDMSKKIQFDVEKENEIIEILGKNNILCNECIVYKINQTDMQISLCVRNKDLLVDKICKVVSKNMNTKFVLHSIMHSTTKNHTILMLKPANVYSIVYGCAGANKNNDRVSGDVHSIDNIRDDCVLVSICDGMGSGSNASELSSRAVLLITDFYKAGFDGVTTLKIVNNLLSQRGEDDFSAVDLGVINLHTGIMDLYKVGATCSFLKHQSGTEILKTGALPLGIVKNAEPFIESVVLNDDDCVVFLSDGVLDSFDSSSALCDYIDTLTDANPQSIANSILARAVELCDNLPKDDMTVLVVKIKKL